MGISIPFSAQSANARTIARICRKIAPEITIVLGGPDVSARYETLLLETPCDYCVIGEGELSFKEFMEKYNAGDSPIGIPGLAYVQDGTVRFVPRPYLTDLDQLPFPAYELVDI